MGGKLIAGNLQGNLQRVQDKLKTATDLAHRQMHEVKLIAVSKTKSIEQVHEAFACGQVRFGENYVQEAVQKARALPEARWHFIGGLQTNKVKLLGRGFSLIHSVDRFKLAQEIDRQVAAHDSSLLQSAGGRSMQDILLQVRVGDEETKQGVLLTELSVLLEEVARLAHLSVRGLMVLPPLTEDEKTARGYFASVREALESARRVLSSEQAAKFTELSMGTSHDFEWAVREGATLVRVGTAIFGAREKVQDSE